MSLRPLFHGHEESAFAEMSLPLEVLHTRIVVEISRLRSLTGFGQILNELNGLVTTPTEAVFALGSPDADSQL
jgi:hypothetical protein